MADEARIPFENLMLTIDHESWAAFLAHHKRDCERFARLARTDKSLKARSARALSESRALLAAVDKLLR